MNLRLYWFEKLKQFHIAYAKRLEEITKRKASQMALQLSEEKWHGLVENAKVGVYQAATDGQILMVNHQLANILGYSRVDEMLSRTENTGVRSKSMSNPTPKRNSATVAVLNVRAGFIRN